MTAVLPLAPHRPPPSRGRRVVAPLATIGGLGLATLALHLRDPHQSGSWGFCPSAALGFWCPGCGGLRAVNDLTNGQVGAALSSNILVTLLIPVAIVALLYWLVGAWRGRPSRVTQNARAVTLGTVAFCAVALAFAVFRNTAAGAWFAP